MPLSVPNELKKIAPYVKRAEELDKDTTSPESRLVAYYCRQYAVHLGIPLAGASPGAKACLGELLSDLEKEKPAMDNFTRDEAAFLCRKFSEGVFNKADAEDREGRASKATAKTFYAAASFLQMLEQFADEDADSDQISEDKKKIVYSKWKSTEILKAIKEGREPTPGGFGGDEEHPEDEQSDSPARATSLGGGFMGHDEFAQPSSADDAGAPAVDTVTDEEDGGFGLPQAPATQLFQPDMPLPPLPPPETRDADMPDDDEGTEVALGPPPAYPGDSDAPPSRLDRPALTFDIPPVYPIPLPSPSSPPKPKSGGLFGGFKKKAPPKQVTKAMILDAAELTRFALAALEDKDANLAAERLQQALEALGH